MRRTLTGLVIALLTAGCNTVDDTAIPSLPVAIDLSNVGMWNTYGVAGFGQCEYFIKVGNAMIEPAGFPSTATTRTGYGGVLLISGMDAFTNEAGVPLAYDLSCPIEKSQTVRVAVDPETLEAVCPECHSHYDVVMRGGAPLSGPAATGHRKYGLTRYQCIASGMGGYYITN